MSTNSVCSLKLKAKLALNFYHRQTLHIDLEKKVELTDCMNQCLLALLIWPVTNELESL